jgi:hypothetical protein
MNANTSGRVVANQKAVTTSPSQLSTTSTELRAGVTVIALPGNGATIYVGDTSGVSSSGGFPLAPSSAITIPIDNLDKVWLMTTSGTQTVGYIGG